MARCASREDQRMRLLVNADDLGSSRKVNAAIFALMAAGRIRSATLIANGRAFDEAISRIGDYPHCSFGVHLNVSSGMPVDPASSDSPLMGADGQFRDAAVRRLFVPADVRHAVFREWRSQLAKVTSAGVAVSHIDSHHHTHTIPALFASLKRLQREFDISRVRLTRCRRQPHALSASVACLGRTIWNRVLRTDGTRTADTFLGLAEFRQLPDAKRGRLRTVEIMAHPGTKEEDRRLLESEWWASQLRDGELISYHQV